MTRTALTTTRELTLSPNTLQIVSKTNVDRSKNTAPPRRSKVVILGDTSVGKTALLGQLIIGEFGQYDSTIVGDIYRKKIKVDLPSALMMNDDGDLTSMSNVEVMFYDTSGNDRYALLLPDIMAKASAAIIVYNVAERLSFDHVDSWLERFRNSVANCSVVIIVGTKLDLAADAATGELVSRVEGEEKASRLNAIFCQVSSKTGQNIDELTRLLGASLVSSVVNQLLITTSQPSAASKQPSTKSAAKMSTAQGNDDRFVVLPPLFKYKIAILGERAVGKTSMLTRFLYDSFDPNYQSTIGIDFFSKNVYIEGRTIRLQLWDTAGQERFRSLIPSYIRNSNAAIIVYDVTDRHSFSEVKHWVDEVRGERGSDAVIMLAANKTDLRVVSPGNDEGSLAIGNPHAMVTPQEGEAKAREIGAFFIEMSAKTGYNIQALFHRMAAALPDLLLTSSSSGARGGQDVVNVEAVSTDENADAAAGAANSNSSCSC